MNSRRATLRFAAALLAGGAVFLCTSGATAALYQLDASVSFSLRGAPDGPGVLADGSGVQLVAPVAGGAGGAASEASLLAGEFGPGQDTQEIILAAVYEGAKKQPFPGLSFLGAEPAVGEYVRAIDFDGTPVIGELAMGPFGGLSIVPSTAEAEAMLETPSARELNQGPKQELGAIPEPGTGSLVLLFLAVFLGCGLGRRGLLHRAP
jgi:hypothetical protein